MGRSLLKPLLLISMVLVAPLVLVAFRGEAFSKSLEAWRREPPSPAVLAAAIVAILASDVVLPVPSGPVSTLAGSQLGVAGGTCASALGMTVGATIAFGAARRWGRPLAERWSSPEQLDEAQRICRDHGPWMLVLTRPLPVLAEAAALLAGALRLPWRRFLPTVIASNVALAAAYAVLGSYAEDHGWLAPAVCASVAAPLAAALWWRRRLRAS
jgi:3-dehydroquinate synthase